MTNTQHMPSLAREHLKDQLHQGQIERLQKQRDELLEALEALEKIGYLNNSLCAEGNGNAILTQARAAIAKAKGEV